MRQRVAFSEAGRALGDAHHRCTVPDAVVAQIRDLREQRGFTLREIVRATGVAFVTVRKIVYYQRRNNVPREYREVECGGFAAAMRPEGAAERAP